MKSVERDNDEVDSFLDTEMNDGQGSEDAGLMNFVEVTDDMLAEGLVNKKDHNSFGAY